jgi:WD40 repeat protein
VTNHAFEQDLRTAFREAVDEEAPAALRASVIAIPETVPTTNQRRTGADRKASLWGRIVPIGLTAAAVVVTVVIGLSLIGLLGQEVGDPSPLPNPSQLAPSQHVSSSVTGNMTIPREGHQAVLLADGRVLVHGGNLSSSSAEIYDPESGTWTRTASTMTERATLTLLGDGRILATGGNEPDNGAPAASAEIYDPETGVWSATGSMITARIGHTATLLADGTVLVAGGTDDGSAELYDPISGTWRPTGSMVEARGGHTATLLLDGTVLVAGGYASNRTAELYDPDTGTWAATDSMPGSHASHTATLLDDGTVLVVGGESMGGRGDPDQPVDEAMRMGADRYDPEAGTWRSAGMMTEYRLYHAATLLPNGDVLVTGSCLRDDTFLCESTEVFDPSTETWRAAGNMIAARSGHTATLLSDGRILIAGGIAGEAWGGVPEEPLPLAELYDP